MTVSAYDALSSLVAEETDAARPRLTDAVIDVWQERYEERFAPTSLVTISFDGVTYLFDNASAVSAPQEDRTLGVVGLSQPPTDKRDASYQRRSPTAVRPGELFDRGHLVPHTAGGVLHVNLFPQLRALNRGWSDDGKLYRAMERRIAVPGTFFFCALDYEDPSWIPGHVELGLVDGGKLDWRRFRNRA